MKSKHDPYCKCYYPALTDPETCTWCYVIREVRVDEYLKAWNEGFEIGFGEGREMSLNEYEGYKSLNKDDAAYVYEQGRSNQQRGIDKWKENIQKGLDKWKEDIDVAYWQGYNNAMIDKQEGIE